MKAVPLEIPTKPLPVMTSYTIYIFYWCVFKEQRFLQKQSTVQYIQVSYSIDMCKINHKQVLSTIYQLLNSLSTPDLMKGKYQDLNLSLLPSFIMVSRTPIHGGTVVSPTWSRLTSSLLRVTHVMTRQLRLTQGETPSHSTGRLTVVNL